MGGTVEVTYAEGELAVAVYDRLLITFVRGPITLDYLDAAHRTGRRLARRVEGAGIGSLTLVPAGASLPTGEVRERASRYTEEANAWVRAGATVVGGQGFFASAARSVLVAITLFHGGPPRRVFADAASGLEWLVGQLQLHETPLEPLRTWSELAMGEDYRLALSA